MSRSTVNLYLSYTPPLSIEPARATFQTHLNYVKRMHAMMENIQVQIPKPNKAPLDITKVEKFERLAGLTRKNITTEAIACSSEHAYAVIAAPWIPVKCYYALYYLEAMFCYFLDSSEGGFSQIKGHTNTRNTMKTVINTGQIVFQGVHAADLTSIITIENAKSFTAKTKVYKPDYHQHEDCPSSIRKKLALYHENDWKLQRAKQAKITAAERRRLKAKFQESPLCLLDYFYLMRIKANYRDLDFLDFDNAVSEEDAYEYVYYYVEASERYANALTDGINTLKHNRGFPGAAAV